MSVVRDTITFFSVLVHVLSIYLFQVKLLLMLVYFPWPLSKTVFCLIAHDHYQGVKINMLNFQVRFPPPTACDLDIDQSMRLLTKVSSKIAQLSSTLFVSDSL